VAVLRVGTANLLFELVLYSWLTGVAAMLLYAVISYIRLLRRKDSVPSPFVYGFVKPKIYIPDGLSGETLRYVTLHEQTHIKRRDHLIKLFAFAVLCVHWFNPFVWAAFLLMGADMEMSCDERVLRELDCYGKESKKAYSMTLISMATNHRIINGSPLAFGEGGAKERIKNVLNFKKRSRILIIAAIALAAVLTVGFASDRALSEESGPLASSAESTAPEPEVAASAAPSEDDINLAEYATGQNVSELALPEGEPPENYRLLREVGTKIDTPQGKGLPWELQRYQLPAVNCVIEKISFSNGEMLVIVPEGGTGWELKAGQRIYISVNIDLSAEYSSKDGEIVEYGYYCDDKVVNLAPNTLSPNRITKDGMAVDFAAPWDGEYSFYLINTSANLESFSRIGITIAGTIDSDMVLTAEETRIRFHPIYNTYVQIS
jgi:hypothetical protein